MKIDKKTLKFMDRLKKESMDEMFSDEGANSMCDYWYKKGRENTIKEIRRLIDKIEDE